MRTIYIYSFLFLSSITSPSLNAGKLRDDLEKGDTSSLIKRLERNVERRNKEQGTDLENAYTKKIDILCDDIIPQVTLLIKENYKDYIGFMDENGTLNKFQEACFIVKTIKCLRKESLLTERGKKRLRNEVEEDCGEKEELKATPTVSHYSPHNQSEIETSSTPIQLPEGLIYQSLSAIDSWYQDPTNYSAPFPPETQKPPIKRTTGRGRQGFQFSEAHQKLLPDVIALSGLDPRHIAERLNISETDAIICGLHARDKGKIKKKTDIRSAFLKPEPLTYKVVHLLRQGVTLANIAKELEGEIPTKNKLMEVFRHRDTAYEWNILTQEEWDRNIGITCPQQCRPPLKKRMIDLTENN